MSTVVTAVTRVRSRVAGRPWVEVAVAIAVFAAFCAVVLARSPLVLEPDDSAYRASIVALTHGHLLLTNAQYQALDQELTSSGGQGVMQWHQLASGMWISEKNPGYPFFAVLFQLLGVLRVTPLFFGALACVALFAGARRWLGRWGGALAVALYCCSGAALVFAWRASMPTFTDASLIAAGAGCLLWAMLARDAAERRRLVVGVLAFLALGAAVFIRYTNVVELAVAVVAVVAMRRAAGVSRRTLAVWLGVAAAWAAGILAFDQLVYGGLLTTGYTAGEITFSPSALLPNLRSMPGQLLRAMPVLVLALAALVWIAARLVRGRARRDEPARALVRRDALVAAALAAGWCGLWALYALYTWTSQMGGGGGAGQTVHVIRFYVPALGLIALLAAWLLVRLPRRLPPVVLVVLATAALLSFQSMASQSIGGAGGFGPSGQPGGGLQQPGGQQPGGQGGQQPPGSGGRQQPPSGGAQPQGIQPSGQPSF